MPRKKVMSVRLPRIKAYARITSGVEWVCPDCGKVHGYTPVKYRKPKLWCKNCEHTFLPALAVGEIGYMELPPMNTRVVERVVRLETTNFDYLPEGKVGIARVRGGVFWLCDCGHWAYDHPEWDTGEVNCPECGRKRAVALVLHHYPFSDAGSPMDWTPPRGVYVPTARKTVTVEKIGEGDGQDRFFAGDLSEAEKDGNEAARLVG